MRMCCDKYYFEKTSPETGLDNVNFSLILVSDFYFHIYYILWIIIIY